MFNNSSADYRPLFWLGGRPVSATLFLIFLHTLAMLGCALALALGKDWLPLFALSSSDVLHHARIWQLITYPFVAAPDIWFVVSMFMLYWFGPDVEQFVGRNYFFGLYATLIIIPGLFLTAWGHFFYPIQDYAGASSVLFGLFIAFVAIYPHVEMFLIRITAFWLAAILLAIYSLASIADHAWLRLAMLWLSTGISTLLIRSLGVATGFGFFERASEWFENRRAEQLARKQNLRVMKEQEKIKSIDSILDKISKHGMGSLNPAEKHLLEQASADLIKRDKQP